MASKFGELKQELRAKVDAAKAAGYEVCYTDECCFTRTSVAKGDWSKRHSNVELDMAHLNEPTQALLLAVS